MPEIKYCNNKEILKILNKIVRKFPYIKRPIFVYVGNNKKAYDDFLINIADCNEKHDINSSSHRIACCFTNVGNLENAKNHIIFLNKDRWFDIFQSEDEMIGDLAHELAHIELSYDMDIKIKLNAKLIYNVNSNKSNPNYFSTKNFDRLSSNEYLTDALVLGRGLGRELSAVWKAMRRYYNGWLSNRDIPPEDIDAFLNNKKDRQLYKIRSVGENPHINGFVTSVYYSGDMKDGKNHGIGKYTGSDGNRFIGKYENGDYVNGVYIYNNGDIYAGDFKHGKRNGYGRLYYSNGYTYVGKWMYDAKSGDGILYNPDGSISTCGTWLNGQLQTIRTPATTNNFMKKADTYTYYGDLKDENFHGMGKLIQSNEHIYVGKFENGHYSVGVYIFPSGNIYVGDFQHGKRNGYGRYYYSDGDTYVGNWKDDNKHGHGELHYENGSAYIGQWKDDKQYDVKFYGEGEPMEESNMIFYLTK